MREVNLPSGAKLVIQLAPFAASKALYQAVLEEGARIKIDSGDLTDANMFKDVFCTALSSKKIESALWECMKRCTYNGLKIDAETFEKEDARQDYVDTCLEVAKDNIHPFVKHLYARYSTIFQEMFANRK